MRTAKMLPLGSGVTAMPKQLMQVSSLSLCFRSTSLRRQVLDSLLNRIVYSPSSTSLSVPSSQQPRGRANFAPYASAPSSAPSSTPSLPAQPSLDTSTAAQWEQVLARAAAVSVFFPLTTAVVLFKVQESLMESIFLFLVFKNIFSKNIFR